MKEIIQEDHWVLDHLLIDDEVKTHIQVTPIHIDSDDYVYWRDLNSMGFKASKVWDLIRARGTPSHFKDTIWFSGHIPRCRFIMWVAILIASLLGRDLLDGCRGWKPFVFSVMRERNPKITSFF